MVTHMTRLHRQITTKFRPEQATRVFLFVILFCIVSLCLFWPTTPSPSIVDFYFLSVGDHGKGSPQQIVVSRQMALVAERYGARFVVTLGDNFYQSGIKGLTDPLIKTRFENIYTEDSLQIPWHIALGDHDHRGSVAAQVAYSGVSARWSLPSPYYVKHILLADGHILDLIVTDSVAIEGAIVSATEERRFEINYNMTYAGASAGQKQLQWLEEVLKGSRATWRIVVGHRPLQSCADRPRLPVEERLRDVLLPLFVKYGVHVYMHGHDHIGQHLEEMGVAYIGNGVGGFGTHPAHRNNLTVWFNSHYQGFALHRVTPSEFEVTFIDHIGDELHKVTLTQDDPLRI